jgi:hypothetical protein
MKEVGGFNGMFINFPQLQNNSQQIHPHGAFKIAQKV